MLYKYIYILEGKFKNLFFGRHYMFRLITVSRVEWKSGRFILVHIAYFTVADKIKIKWGKHSKKNWEFDAISGGVGQKKLCSVSAFWHCDR